MKNSITEEIRLRHKIVLYALKCGNNAKAARRYHTSRQQVARWVNRYDGTVESLMPRSRKPKSHPNAHSEQEISLVKRCYKRYRRDGLAEVYVQCRKRGYTRSYTSLLKIIRLYCKKATKVVKTVYPKSNFKPEVVTFPGEKVQIDLKYVPATCLKWDTKGKRYYQITAIDEYSRKRVCQIVDEKSVTNTATFLLTLEEKMGFKIHTVQTDNGREFTNDPEQKERESLFEEVLRLKGIQHKKTRPYSPWQNGKVERSHREDSKHFYCREFKSLNDLVTKHALYVSRQNNCAKKVLGLLSPNQVVQNYFAKVA